MSLNNHTIQGTNKRSADPTLSFNRLHQSIATTSPAGSRQLLDPLPPCSKYSPKSQHNARSDALTAHHKVNRVQMPTSTHPPQSIPIALQSLQR